MYNTLDFDFLLLELQDTTKELSLAMTRQDKADCDTSWIAYFHLKLHLHYSHYKIENQTLEIQNKKQIT